MDYVCLYDGEEYQVRYSSECIASVFLLTDSGCIRKRINPTREMLESFYEQIKGGFVLNCEKENKYVLNSWAKKFLSMLSSEYKFIVARENGQSFFATIDRPILDEKGNASFKVGVDISDLVPLDVIGSASVSTVIERE